MKIIVAIIDNKCSVKSDNETTLGPTLKGQPFLMPNERSHKYKHMLFKKCSGIVNRSRDI